MLVSCEATAAINAACFLRGVITIIAASITRVEKTAIFSFILTLALALTLCPAAFAYDASDNGEAALLLQRIDKCQTSINKANKEIKQAEKEYAKATAAAKKAQAKIEKQEAQMEELQEALEQLSVSLYKGSRSDHPLLDLLDADSFNEFDKTLSSMGTIADEEAQLIEKARQARDELEKAKRSYDLHAEQAREQKEAAEKTRKEAETLHDELVAQAAKITSSIADNEARRSLATAIASKAFPKGSSLQNPCPDAVKSSGFGYRDFDHEFHQGLDLAAAEGTPYYAAASGTVIYATNDGKDNGGAGNWIVIAHGDGIVTKYMHSQRTLVKVGDIVTQGQLIGAVGETGAAFGAHLHFQVEVDGTAIDPEKAMQGQIKKQVYKDEESADADEQQADEADEAEQPAEESPVDEAEQPADEQPVDEAEQPVNADEQPADEVEQPVYEDDGQAYESE